MVGVDKQVNLITTIQAPSKSDNDTVNVTEVMPTIFFFKGDECLTALQKHIGFLADCKRSVNWITIVTPLLVRSAELQLCVWNLGIDLEM